MNGTAQRIAEVSVVRGAQWSTDVPKKVSPKASPSRTPRKRLIAAIEAS